MGVFANVVKDKTDEDARSAALVVIVTATVGVGVDGVEGGESCVESAVSVVPTGRGCGEDENKDEDEDKVIERGLELGCKLEIPGALISAGEDKL